MGKKVQMTNIFHPSFTGCFRPDHLSKDCVVTLTQRIHTGLFPAASPLRNRCVVESQSDDSLRFRSANTLAGINVGLNDVTIEVDKECRQVNYSVTYWTWARYCMGLALMLGLAIIAGRYWLIPAPYHGPYVNVVFWPNVIFWCVIWPWLLIPLHKGSARKCLAFLMRLTAQAKKMHEELAYGSLCTGHCMCLQVRITLTSGGRQYG